MSASIASGIVKDMPRVATKGVVHTTESALLHILYHDRVQGFKGRISVCILESVP